MPFLQRKRSVWNTASSWFELHLALFGLTNHLLLIHSSNVYISFLAIVVIQIGYAPPMAQKFLDFMFLRKLTKSYVGAPLRVGVPSYWESWIRPWYLPLKLNDRTSWWWCEIGQSLCFTQTNNLIHIWSLQLHQREVEEEEFPLRSVWAFNRGQHLSCYYQRWRNAAGILLLMS